MVVSPAAEVLGAAAGALVTGALEAAAAALVAAELADPELDALLLPHAASRAAAAATPGAAHHRIRIMRSLHSGQGQSAPHDLLYVSGARIVHGIQAAIAWQSQARDSGYR
jgi:hypothetical protein